MTLLRRNYYLRFYSSVSAAFGIVQTYLFTIFNIAYAARITHGVTVDYRKRIGIRGIQLCSLPEIKCLLNKIATY